MALLRPATLFIFGKSSHLHCFLRNEYQKNTHLHVYQFLRKPPSYRIIRTPRLLGTPEYLTACSQHYAKGQEMSEEVFLVFNSSKNKRKKNPNFCVKETFNNYVDQIVPNFDPLPPHMDNCGHFTWNLSFVMWPRVDFQLTSSPLLLVHVDIEWPLRDFILFDSTTL